MEVVKETLEKEAVLQTQLMADCMIAESIAQKLKEFTIGKPFRIGDVMALMKWNINIAMQQLEFLGRFGLIKSHKEGNDMLIVIVMDPDERVNLIEQGKNLLLKEIDKLSTVQNIVIQNKINLQN